MRKIITFVAALTVLIGSGPAYAHDQELHHGKPVMGNIAALNDGGFAMETDGGAVMVKLLPETKFETGKDGAAGSRDDLKIGAHTMVYGTKLETGELVAKEVMIHEMKIPKPSGSKPMEGMHHDMSGHGSMDGTH